MNLPPSAEPRQVLWFVPISSDSVVTERASKSAVVFLGCLPLPIAEGGSPTGPKASAPVNVRSPNTFEQKQVVSASSNFEQ